MPAPLPRSAARCHRAGGRIELAGGRHPLRDVAVQPRRRTAPLHRSSGHSLPAGCVVLHDTIRANLLYARPSASEQELILADSRAELERLAAGNVKRVFLAEDDWGGEPTPRRMLAFLETKTVWHPVGI